ncbi:MAG TPA: hypothetical protein VFE24_14985 [Pirellulales bacterium]|jgi:hypothetical protein|nr:hypothetical protein [Pirellulales bacterium]
MRFESEAGRSIENPAEADLNRLLGELNGSSNSYASLTMPDGSYIQAGGGPSEFTVEVRNIRSGDSFVHWKAGRKNGRVSERQLLIGGASVTVGENQILDLATVQQLFSSFQREQTLDGSMQWRDISSMFAQ